MVNNKDNLNSEKGKIKKENSKKKILKKKKYPKINLRTDKDIAMDFAVKVYKKFDKIIKAIVLFGSTNKGTSNSTSDIDIIIVIDDAAIQWDQELIAWYREELGKIVTGNNYKKDLHITTTKLTTWWADLMNGDPVVVNVLRHGEALIDIGGFFNPLKSLLIQGRIKPSPESIYTALQRAPEHFRRSRMASLGAIEGLFWAMVDASQAALMAANVIPPSPEKIPALLKETFVDRKMLKMNYVAMSRELYELHRGITHGDVTELKGGLIAEWQDKIEDYIGVMTGLVKVIVEKK